jgi:hypothetical protein
MGIPDPKFAIPTTRHNSRLQRTWPAFSSSIAAAVTAVAFGEVVLLPNAGHAAEAQCWTATRHPLDSALP